MKHVRATILINFKRNLFILLLNLFLNWMSHFMIDHSVIFNQPTLRMNSSKIRYVCPSFLHLIFGKNKRKPFSTTKARYQLIAGRWPYYQIAK